MRAGRWGIAALTAALLAACGGGGSPGAQSAKTVTVTASPTSTSTSTTAAPASTATSGSTSASTTSGATPSSTATGGPATKQIVLTLPNPDGGWKVEESADALNCGGEPSLVATSGRTYDCGPSAASAVACVADNGGSHILCAMQPWARKATRFPVDGTLPTTSKPANPVPLGIELADGSRWFIRSGGAWPPGPQETAAMYSCSEGCGGESKENDGCPMTITVEALDAQSSAMVSEFGSGCGGGMAMWGVKKGRWIKVWSGQDVPLCSELRAKGAVLNPDVIGRCSGPAPAFTAQRYTP